METSHGKKTSAHNDGDGTESGDSIGDGKHAGRHTPRRSILRSREDVADGESEGRPESDAADSADVASSDTDAGIASDVREWIKSEYSSLLAIGTKLGRGYGEDAVQAACEHLLSRKVEPQYRRLAAINAMKVYIAKHGHIRYRHKRLRLQRVPMTSEITGSLLSTEAETPSMIFWDSMPLTSAEKTMVRAVIEDGATLNQARRLVGLNYGQVVEQQRRYRAALVKIRTMTCHMPMVRV